MTDTMITAALVSGDQLFREAFGRLGSHIGVEVVHQADTVAKLLSETEEMPQLVILVGWTTGDADFLEQVAQLRERTQGSRLLVLTDTAEPQSMHEALQAGVDGFLHRNMSSEALSHSIRLIMYGQAVVPMSVVSKFLDSASTRRGGAVVTAEANSLTPRERDILSLLAEGQPNKVIARRLGTCDGTVKVHLRRIMRKLGVQNRTQAAIWALDHLQDHEVRELAS